MSEASDSDFSVVAIGASAGGIGALKRFFESMQPDSGMAFVVILHLSEEHESNLAEILQKTTAMPVAQVNETIKVEPNQVYVIPPAKQLTMVDGSIKVGEPERVRGRRMPIDLFFRSLADAYGRRAVAIILSGTGSDGTLGLKRIKENGGIAFAQEPADAEYDNMPRSAIATNLVDIVLPASEMSRKLFSTRQLAKRLEIAEDKLPAEAELSLVDAVREVITLLRIRTGHDFSGYKRPTLLRRIARRMQVHELETVASYINVLRERPDELEELLRDLLITVTNFFRDKETFDALEREVVPQLFAGKQSPDTIRVWVCGCATGEEAYSIAILLDEFAAQLLEPPKIQIFASDINEDAIRLARDGRYDETIIADVSPERLQRYFVKKGDFYIISKHLRERVLFAPHNILRDPPFSRLDLITCRNLLIYLNRETQERLLELFNFALRHEGFLFLGSSESAENSPRLFAAIDKKQRIYKSLGAIAQPPLPMTRGRWEVKNADAKLDKPEQPISFGALHYKLVEEYAPPSVLIDEDYDIVHSSENAARFLHFAGGEPSRNLLKVAHPGLQLDLRLVLTMAKQENRQTEARHISVKLDNEERKINLIVRRREIPETARVFFLVIFDEGRSASKNLETPSASEMIAGDEAMKTVVGRLEDELQQTRDRLRATIEQSETSTEELKASNEELQAINEELRSASEELETGKEELQSLNEELTTVNLELKEKVDEVSRVNSDLQNLMHSTDIGTIFLDRALQIKRFTPRVKDLFNIISSDIGRPFEHLTHKLDYNQLAPDAAEVLKTLQPRDREVSSEKNRGYYLARLSPYRTLEDRIDGVVISFVDVTQLKQATDTLRDRELMLRMAQDAANCGVWTLFFRDGRAWWSDECYRVRGVEPGSMDMTMQNWIYGFHSESGKQVEAAICEAVEKHTEYNFESQITLPSGKSRWLMEVGRGLYNERDEATQISGITLDITERVEGREARAEQLAQKVRDADTLKQADRRKSEFLATLSHELRNPLEAIRIALELMESGTNRDHAQQIIKRQVAQVIHLVDDLMDISRIERGKILLQKTHFDLADALNFALETIRSLSKEGERQILVSLPEKPIYVEADFTRISQIFLNLLHNAVKYTKSGGTIRLTAEGRGNQAIVSVKDTGIGITAEMLANIFETFAQLENKLQSSGGGLGIGLGLVKKLVELHGGTINALSEGLGKGSEFVVRLPMAAGQSAKISAAPKASDSGRSKKERILVVDDHMDSAEVLKIYLTHEGYTVVIANDGESAIQLAQVHQPDIALLDIGLPNKDGYQVARELRETLPDIKLIAISGWGQEEYKRRSTEAGFNCHLVKPIEVDKLRQVLDN